MYGKLQQELQAELKNIEEAGLYKKERIITTPMGAEVKVNSGEDVIIMCANNYLGLSSHPKVIEGAKKALDTHGYGMSSVRFICGTQDIHKTLEHKISNFLGMEDTSYMQRLLMLMEEFLSHFFERMMLLFQINKTCFYN